MVRATALRKLRRSKVDLSLTSWRFQRNRSEPILIESMPELEQLQALTLQVQQLTSAMVDMDKRHMQEIQQRDLQVAEMRGTLTALKIQRFSRRCNPSTDNGRRGKPSSSNGELTSLLRTESTRELLDIIDDPTKDERNGDLDLENQELSMQLYFALVLVMPRESVVELSVRNVKQGEGAVAWRQILGEYASTEPGNFLAMWSKLGDLQFPQGSDIVVGINKMEEDMTRYQKMPGENLSDTIKRGILMKALTNEAELQKYVFRNSTHLSTYEKMREEVMSALTAERALHEPMGTIRWRLEPSARAARKAQARKERA